LRLHLLTCIFSSSPRFFFVFFAHLLPCTRFP